MRPRPVFLRLIATATLAAGCGGEGPATTPIVDRTEISIPETQPRVIRQVEQRRPFGSLDTNNLLVDGDFEWHRASAKRYGWWADSTAAFLQVSHPTMVVGPMCRSGLKCASVGVDGALIALAVAAPGQSMKAQVFARVGSQLCSAVDVQLITPFATDLETASAVISATTPRAKGGWCRYATGVGARDAEPFLFVHNVGTEPIVVDEASLLAIAEESDAFASPKPSTENHATSGRQAHARRVQAVEAVANLVRTGAASRGQAPP